MTNDGPVINALLVDHSCLVIAISDHEGVRLGDHSCLVIVISDQYGHI